MRRIYEKTYIYRIGIKIYRLIQNWILEIKRRRLIKILRGLGYNWWGKLAKKSILSAYGVIIKTQDPCTKKWGYVYKNDNSLAIDIIFDEIVWYDRGLCLGLRDGEILYSNIMSR